MLRTCLLLSTCLGCLALARTSAAAPTNDVRTGSSIYFREGRIRLDGERYHETDYRIHKASGSLDVVIDARRLGLDFDLALRLHGVASGGNTITWTFDQRLPRPYGVGGGADLRRVQGRIIARAERIIGASDPYCGADSCPYNIRLRAAAGSYVRVSGDKPLFFGSWRRTSTELDFELLAGVPRPVLREMTFDAPEQLCQTSYSRTYAGRVFMASGAPDGGAHVDLTSTDPRVLSRRRVHIRRGWTSGSYLTQIPAGYSGVFVVQASAGGAKSTRRVHVRPLSECLAAMIFKRLTPRWTKIFRHCPACVDSILLNDSAQNAAFRYRGEWYMGDEQQDSSVSEMVGQSVSSVAFNRAGDIVGSVGEGAKRQGFYFPANAKEAIGLGEFIPHALTGEGIVLGRFGSEDNSQAAYFNGHDFEKVPVEGVSSMVGATDDGYIFVNQGTPPENGTPLRILRGESFPLLPNDIAELLAVNAGGSVVGWLIDGQGRRQAFLLRAESKRPYLIEPPIYDDRFDHCRPVGISDDGLVLVNAVDREGEVLYPFVYSPKTGALPLEKVAHVRSMNAYEGLAIARNGDLIVRASVDGKHTIVVLSRSFSSGELQRSKSLPQLEQPLLKSKLLMPTTTSKVLKALSVYGR